MADIKPYIEPLLNNQNLTREQATEVLDHIFTGEVTEPQIAAFLTALRCKGITADELAGLALSLREHAYHVETDVAPLIDTCSTGGAKIKTFNISTAAAFVAAGAGVYVAKHGNRGITSPCGSADVLAALGVNIECDADQVATCIEQAHIGFMFAPRFHPAMKYVQPIRKALGFRTAFNILGPLANPAKVARQVMGVGDEGLMELVAEALVKMGVEHAMVVHSDGLDEISTMGPTRILEIRKTDIHGYRLDLKEIGIQSVDPEKLVSADAENNAKLIRTILTGKETGPPKDIVVLNAAAALIVAGKAADFATAIAAADLAIEDGAAAESLQKLIEVSNK